MSDALTFDAAAARLTLCEQLSELTGAHLEPEQPLTLGALCQLVDSLGSEVPAWCLELADAEAGLESDADTVAAAVLERAELEPLTVEVRFCATLHVPLGLLEADGTAGPDAVDWLLAQLGASLGDFVLLEDDDQ